MKDGGEEESERKDMWTHLATQSSGKKIFCFPQVVENPHKAIVNPRGFGLMEILTFKDFQFQPPPWDLKVLTVEDLEPKPIFLNYKH